MPSLPEGRNQRWSIDFVLDGLADGRRIRVLTLVDNYNGRHAANRLRICLYLLRSRQSRIYEAALKAVTDEHRHR